MINVDNCPSDEVLDRFLSDNDAGSVGVHLRTCTRCQESLDRLSDDRSLRPMTRSSGESAWDWGDPIVLSPIVEALRNRALLDHTREQASDGTPLSYSRDLAQSIGTPGSLGTYDIEDEIGRGGIGTVFRARDRTTGRLVAVKVLFAGNDDERNAPTFRTGGSRGRKGRA